MKFTLNINKLLLEVEFSSANGRTLLVYDGREYEAEVSEPEPDLFVVMIDGRIYRCAIDRLPNGATEISVNGKRISVAIRDRKHRRGNERVESSSDKRATLTALMPGKVVRVLCAVGDEVIAGQGVLVIEAMKMQNEVQSPKAGQVVEVCVQEGQTVNASEVLAIIE